MHTNKHDDAGVPLVGSEGWFSRIKHFAELVENGVLDDATLVVTSSEIFQIDDLLDIGLHIADELELHIGLEKSAGDLIEALVEDLLVDHGRIAHLLESTGDAPS